MEQEIIKIVEETWNKRLSLLMEEVARTTRQIEDVLVLQDYYINGHRDEKLGQALGDFGTSVFDIKTMGTLLRQSDISRSMEKGRHKRAQHIFDQLNQLRKTYQDNPPQCVVASMDKEALALFAQIDDHLNKMAETFRLLRLAKIEANAKYQPNLHDNFFAHFNWGHLENAEMSLCPPFVVLAKPQKKIEPTISKIIQLVSSGKPFKIIFPHEGLKEIDITGGRESLLKSTMDIELLPITLRSVYMLQTASSNSHLGRDLAKGLISPRPAVFSLFWNQAKDEPSQNRAQNAISSRAFPRFMYDPDISPDFVQRISLLGNPDLEQVWSKVKLEYQSEEGETQQLEKAFTFADFAYEEEFFKNEFNPLPENVKEEQTIPLSEYLCLTPTSRIKKTPVIYIVDTKKKLTKLVPSKKMILMSADRMHLWKTFQELAGIENPHVIAKEKEIKGKLVAEKETAIQALKQEMAAQIKTAEREAVVRAMKNLALRLTGKEGKIEPLLTQISSTAQLKTTTTVSPTASAEKTEASQKAAAPTSDLPWIESKLCTTCDECTTINKKIFVYNKDKQAIIKDAKAGSFKDIVKAAEKCSARIIHPGKPQNPNEKDLDKLIKRAEPFQ